MALEQKGPRGFRLVDEPEGDAAGSGGEALPPMTFGVFLLMLSTSARVHLGDAAAPGGEKADAPDLELARQTIDILTMLEGKTRDNLDPEERQLLESLLHDLRMRFVEVTGSRRDSGK